MPGVCEAVPVLQEFWAAPVHAPATAWEVQDKKFGSFMPKCQWAAPKKCRTAQWRWQRGDREVGHRLSAATEALLTGWQGRTELDTATPNTHTFYRLTLIGNKSQNNPKIKKKKKKCHKPPFFLQPVWVTSFTLHTGNFNINLKKAKNTPKKQKTKPTRHTRLRQEETK